MKYKKHIGMMISCIYLMKKALYNTQEQHQQKKNTPQHITIGQIPIASIADHYTAVYNIFAYRGDPREHIILHATKRVPLIY